MAEPHAEAVRRWNEGAVLLSAALGNRIVEPDSASSSRCFHIVEPYIDVALSVSADVRDDVRPCARQKGQREFGEFHIEVLDPGAVATHVQYVEIIDIDVIAAVTTLARPELGVGIALDNVSGFTKASRKRSW